MRIYKVKPDDCRPCCEKNLDDVKAWIECALPGDKITINVIEMTEEEYNSLPEYEGP